MATAPLICNAINFEGLILQRCNLQVVNGTKVLKEISLCGTNIIIKKFSSFKGCIYPNSSLLLNAEELGEISFLLVKVTYPSSLLVASRYITAFYKGKIFPISNLMILTGTPGETPGTGWDLSPYVGEIYSPHFESGGMVLINPHSVRVTVETIMASGI